MSTLVATTEIKEWGNSLAVRIPKKIKDALGFHNGSRVSISLEGKKVILESSENPFFNLSKDVSLNEVLNKITAKNKHLADDFKTKPIGREVW
jgi:antitoxin MazE